MHQLEDVTGPTLSDAVDLETLRTPIKSELHYSACRPAVLIVLLQDSSIMVTSGVHDTVTYIAHPHRIHASGLRCSC